MKKGKQIWVTLLVIIAITVSTGKGYTSNEITSQDTDTYDTNASTMETEEVISTADLPDYQESESLKSFLFGFKDWNKVSDTDVQKAAKKLGLICEDQLGWGGTYYTYTITDPANKDNTLKIIFARADGSRKLHFSYLTFYAPDVECSFTYYGTWHGKNTRDGKTGYWFDSLEFKTLRDVYQHCISVASG